jgi:hypothetical protein
LEINLFLQISPLNILIDQLTLKFLSDFYKISLDTDEGKPNNNTNDEYKDSSPRNNLPSEAEEKSITQINNISQLYPYLKNRKLSAVSDPHDKYTNSNVIPKINVKTLKSKRVIIQEYFINFCYFSRELSFQNLREKKLFEILNISSINDLKLEFKSFDFTGNKKFTEVICDVYTFWKDDILKSQIVNAYLSSITMIRPFKNVVGGIIELFRQPYKNYQEDKSVQEGVVHGVRIFLVSFTTETLLMGEKVKNIFYN